MITTSNEYKSAIAKSGRHFEAKLIVGDKVYTKFKSLKIKGGTNSGNEITFGDNVSAMLEATLVEKSTVSLNGQKCILYIGLQLADKSIDWIKRGVYNIENPTKNDDFCTITAYDNFALCNKGFFSDLKGSQKITAILDEQCKKIGISFVGGADDVSYDVDRLQGMTIREAIGVLASYCGKNAVMDPDGNLKFIWYMDTGITVDASLFADPLNIGEDDILINKIECATGEKDTILTVGTGLGMSFACPGMTQSRLETLYNRMKGFRYRKALLNWRIARPDVEAGDIIVLRDRKGNEYKVPLMEFEFSFDGGFYGTVESKGKTEIQKQTEFRGTLQTKVERVYTETISTKELLAEKIVAWEGEFESITTNYISVTGKLEAFEAEIKTIKSDLITTTYLEANFARVDLANIKDGCITTAMIGTGVVGNAQIADGSITDAKIVGLTANKITAGRLDAAEIEVINLNCANLTVGTINGQQIANGAIDWDKLGSQVSGSITTAGNNANQALQDAQTAFDEAVKAQTSASNALTTANGKNKNYYQATPPTGTFVVGDTWFDTDNDMKISYWNGTAWDSKPFGSSAIEDGAFGAEKFTNDVNTKINSAFTNATSALTSATDANNKIDGLQIGGRNYILNSANISCDLINKTGNKTEWVALNVGQSYMEIPDGTEVAVSFDLEMVVNTENAYLLVYNTNSQCPKSIDSAVLNFNDPVGTTIKKRCFVITKVRDRPEAEVNTYDNYIEFYSAYGTSNWFKITNIKLETGNKATDHSPAPEDFEQGITDAKSMADAINAIVDANKPNWDKAPSALDVANTVKGAFDSNKPKWDTASTNASNALTNASNAQQSADTAKQVADAITNIVNANKSNWDKASTALTTANGKNTVIYSATPPPVTGRIENDTWYDTDNGHKLYRFTNGAWKAIEFGSDAIANDVITADKIANEVNQKIDDAFADAGLAKTTAESAKSTANSASTTANNASSLATTAKNTADSAKSTADSAKSTATTASNNASTALSTANTAKSTADVAKSTADGAKNIADAKAKVFIAQPTTPYQVGDLWVQGASGVIMRCKASRASGSYTASDWEKADKYTDDTKANEVNAKVTTVSETVLEQGTKLNVQEGKISTLITDTTQVKKDITAIQDEVVIAKGDITTLESNYSTLEQTVTGINSTVGQHTSSIATITTTAQDAKTLATNAKNTATSASTTATTAKNTADTAKATADTAKSTADSAKTTATTASSNANTALSTANTAKSTADTAKSTATTAKTVADNANKKIDELEIGGRNFIVLSKLSSYGSYNTRPTHSGDIITSNWVTSWNDDIFTLQVAGFIPKNAFYTISGYLKVDGQIPSTKYFVASANTYCGETKVNTYDSKTGYFVITQKYTGSSVWILHAQTARVGGSAGTVALEKLMFEEGTKPSTHRPSPEDVDEAITAVDGRVTTEIKTVTDRQSTFEQTLNSITTRVSSTETNISTVTNTVNTNKANWDKAPTALSTANTAKSTADSAKATATSANTTATTAKATADTAKSTADTAKTTADSAKSTATTASNNASTALSTANTAKSTADTAKTTATNAKTVADSALLKASVDNLGGELKKFKNVCGYSLSGEGIYGYLVITTPIIPQKMVTMRIRGYNYNGGQETIDITVSFYNYATYFANCGYVNNGTRTLNSVKLARVSSSDLRAVVILGDSNTNWRYPKIVIDEVIVGHGAVPDSYKDGYSISITNTLPTTYANMIAIEGTDVKDSILTTKSQIAEHTTQLGSITSRVSTTESSISTINGNVSSLTSRISTAEQKITDSAIVSTVTKSTNWTSLASTANSALSTANTLVDLTRIKDTRSVNSNPKWYFDNYPQKTVKEFKYCSTMEVSGEDGYGVLVTEVPWTDSSGGYPNQLFYPNNSQNVYRRVGTSATTWSAWTKVAGSHNIVSTINQTAESIKISASKIDLTGYVTITNLSTAGQTTIDGGNIKTRTLAATALVANSITAQSGVIANAAITSAMIANLAVGNAQIANGAITSAKIANLAVGTAQIADGAINNAKIANLDAGKITTGILSADRIGANSIVLGKLDTATQGVVNVSKAQQTNYGYRYAYSIEIKGEHNKYYPVVLRGGNQGVMREILITRGYNEKCPPEWNGHPTAKGITLTLKIKCNFGGWGGANYSWFIHDFEEMYGTLFAGAEHCMSFIGFAIFLRGGGTNGAIYHIYSDQPINVPAYNGTSPQICYNQERIGWSGGTADAPTYSWNAPAPRTEPRTNEITPRIYTKVAQALDGVIADWCYANDKTYINGGKIYTGSVTANQIASNAIIAGKIATDAVTAGTIVAGAVTADKIATNAVTAVKILAGAITTDKIASNAITAVKIASNAITAVKIASRTITADKLVAKTLTAASGVFADACIVTANIANLAVTTAKIANLAVGTAQLANASITTAKIANAQITNALIANAAVDNAKIANVDAGKITTGYLNAGRIQAGTIALGKLDTTAQNKINYASIMAVASMGGKLVYKDPQFASGENGVGRYNNSGGTHVTVTRIAKPADCPSTSEYTLEIKHTGTTASPGYGGFVQGVQSRANAHFVIKYIIKLPVGYRLIVTANTMGDGYVDRWLTDNVGTGKYTEYVREVICGSTGSFLSGGHVYVLGSPAPTTSAPLVWYLAGIWQYDITGMERDIDSVITAWCYNNDTTYINGGKIYTGSITANQIATNAITAGKIAANAVTTATIAANAVNADKIATNAIVARHITVGTITGDKLVAGTITGGKIAARTISANKIIAGTITSAEIKAGTITADKLNVASLSAISANIGNITSGSLNIGSGKFVVTSAGALTATNATITGTINGGSITGQTTINVGTDLRVGNNIYIGSYEDRSIRKFIYMNDIFDIHSQNDYIMFGLNGSDMLKGRMYVSSKGACTVNAIGTAGLICTGGDIIISSKNVTINSDTELRMNASTANFKLYKPSSTVGELQFTGQNWFRIKNASGDGTNQSGIQLNLGKNSAYLELYYTTSDEFLNYRTNCSSGHWFNGNVSVGALINRSRERYKSNIVPFSYAHRPALELIEKSVVYEFNLKEEIERGIYQKHYGFVVERETPKEIIAYGGDGIDTYSLATLNWQATKELIEETRNSKKYLENQIAMLRSQIIALEQRLAMAQQNIS